MLGNNKSGRPMMNAWIENECYKGVPLINV